MKYSLQYYSENNNSLFTRVVSTLNTPIMQYKRFCNKNCIVERV